MQKMHKFKDYKRRDRPRNVQNLHIAFSAEDCCPDSSEYACSVIGGPSAKVMSLLVC